MVPMTALLWIIIASLPTVFSDCNGNLDDDTCTYDMSCTGTLNDVARKYAQNNQGYGYNSYNYNYDNYPRDPSNRKCTTSSGVYSNGNYWYKINLRFNMTSQQTNEIMMFPLSPITGIEYDSTKNTIIISLDLSQQSEIELTQFPILRSMKNLIKLDISRNMISVAMISNKYELPLLEEIDYSHNKMEKIVSPENDAFIFTKLKKINMSYNKIVQLPQAVFENIKELEFLDLSNNYIETLDAMIFEGVKKLLTLNMSTNKIVDIDSSLLRFSNLEELSLDHNEIQTLTINNFKNLLKLEKIDLSFNAINKIDKSAFIDMVCLHTISLSNNLVQDLDRDIFNTTALTYVDLSNNNIHTLPQYLLKGKQITYFSIESNILQGSLQRGMFEGLVSVNRLDLSKQNLETVEEDAFFGMKYIEIILLNNNNIDTVAKEAFKDLKTLNELNLCYNKITSINFINNDLINVNTLILSWNCITEIKKNQLGGLYALNNLDLSNNNISRLEPNALNSLGNLTTLKIFKNPLNGDIENSTFAGLNSLPNLDISNNFITSIKNTSFFGMEKLKELNISHSKVAEIQYNAFLKTGNIEDLDISYNNIKHFSLNVTSLSNIRNLILNNNHIKHIEHSTFSGLSHLSRILLSYNDIETINKNAFIDQTEMIYLDMSYNINLIFDVSYFNKSKNLHNLLLTAIPLNNFEFTNITDSALTQLSLSYSAITDIKILNIKRLMKLEDLCISNNKLTKLEIGSFSNMSYLNRLDLSFNKINAIQPGVFKDNNVLTSLNISHNSLLFLSYGIFRGLGLLNTLDISYNSINNVVRERFYELINMRILIADHNKIEYISPEELPRLKVLSIGANPLPCNLLVNLQNIYPSLSITAVIKDESSENALLGVTCKNGYTNKKKVNTTVEADKTINDIKEILQSISNKMNIDEPLIENESVSLQIEKSFAKNNNKLSELSSNIINEIDKLSNETYSSIYTIGVETKNTNENLEKILKVLTTINARRVPVTPARENVTYNDIINYINNIKQELTEAAEVEKQNIVSNINNEISIIKSQLKSIGPVHDKLTVNHTQESGYLVTEICVALILIIMLLSFVYKLYKYRFRRNSRTTSTLQFNDNSLQL